MPDRRSNQEGEVKVEYAVFIAEIRGLRASVLYLDSAGVAREVLHRILRFPEQRRTRERRTQPRS